MGSQSAVVSLRLVFGLAVGLLCFGADFDMPAAAETDYHLASGDVLEFDFLDDDQLPRQLIVASDGSIQVPLLGSIKVAGMYTSDALEELRREFLDRNLLVEPRISLSVVSFRPIYVLGEVKNPGSFPFQPLLTVEQAVGLAGGPMTVLGTAEDRIVTRARLLGDLDRISADLTREAIAAAQAIAKLKNAMSISLEDIPKVVRPYLNDSLSAELRKLGENILAVEQQSFDTQKNLLTEGIAEAESQLGILDQLAANQKATIQASNEQIARSKELFKKRLIVANEILNLERQFTTDESRLLSIYSEMSSARQRISASKRDLSLLEEVRKKETLTQLQERNVLLEKLLAERQSTAQQLYLVSNLVVDEGATSREITLDYKIRRRTTDGSEEQEAANTTMLSPGDVVLVAIKKPGTKASALQ